VRRTTLFPVLTASTLIALAASTVLHRGRTASEQGHRKVTVVYGVSLSRRLGGFLATNQGEVPASVSISTLVPEGTFGVPDRAEPGADGMIEFSQEISLAPGSSRWIDFRDLRSRAGSRLESRSVVILASRASTKGGWPFQVITATPHRVTRDTLRVRKVFEGVPLP